MNGGPARPTILDERRLSPGRNLHVASNWLGQRRRGYGGHDHDVDRWFDRLDYNNGHDG